MQIIDTPVTESVPEFADDVKNLIAAGAGKSATYGADDGITDEKSANSLKIKFQRTANKFDRTARADVAEKDGKWTVTFTLRPKQKTRETPAPADTAVAAPAESADTPKPAKPGK